ncbi:hypothetical protein BJX96DRAFT_2026 [Aspergillus floccosus]
MSTPRQRSHDGCWTCKAKRRKCDRMRPACLACNQRGIACEGYEVRLRWGSGIASRGRYTGAEEPVDAAIPFREKGRRRDRLRERQRQWSERLSEDTAGYSPLMGDGFGVLDGAPRTSQSGSTPDSTVSPSWCPEFPTDEERLFYQFLSSGIHTLHSTAVNDAGNLLEPRLPGLCQKSKALYIICVTFQSSISRDMRPRFFEFFDAALNQFRVELSRSVARLEDETLTAGLILCSIGLVHGLPWTMHLHGMYRILQTQGLDVCRDQRSPFRAHLLEVMGVMDLPTFAIGRQNPSLGFWKAYCTIRQKQSPDDDGVEVMSGIPRSLIDIFSRIEEGGATEEDFWNWPGCKGTLTQHQLWEAYRMAGILTVRHGQLHQGPPTARPQAPRNPRIPETGILVPRILSCLDAICRASVEPDGKDSLILNAIHYPVFVAGLQSKIINTDPAYKHVIRRCFFLRRNHSEIGVDGNLLLELLEECWQNPAGDTDVHALARSRGVELGLH